MMEGIGCLIGGLWGSGVGTTSYSENISAIGITKVWTTIMFYKLYQSDLHQTHEQRLRDHFPRLPRCSIFTTIK